MATKKPSSSNNGKGVALLKRAKIDSAQKNMLVAVCLASIVLGVTIVGAVYLTKKIKFNATKISENSTVIDQFKETQKNLSNLSVAISELAKDEKLEVVASDRSNTKCDPAVLKTIESEDGYDLDDIEVVRTCSALRAIADTLPSQMNQEATNSSINWLIIHSDKKIKLQGITNAENAGSSTIQSEDGTQLNLKSLGISVGIKDKPTKVNQAISAIESSIRNFDIATVNISWSDYERGANSDSEIDFSAIYRSYYSDKVSIDSKEKVICADDSSEKCAKAKRSGSR
ncbi:MAG: hypothetical protein K6F57_03995 [Candidatus Saccharibacteria bacterium]|nr:hypothetical protein [Candidatus Saccharibacteria bacterium]